MEKFFSADDKYEKTFTLRGQKYLVPLYKISLLGICATVLY